MKRFNITVNGKPFDVTCEEVAVGAQKAQPIQQPPIEQQTSQTKEEVISGATKIKAPMPGNINSVKISVGQTVKAGDILVILEAMKMENEIMSPKDGKITSVDVSQGDGVETDQLICTMD